MEGERIQNFIEPIYTSKEAEEFLPRCPKNNRDYWTISRKAYIGGDVTAFAACFIEKMKALEEKIIREGTVLPGGVLKVGSFLNQQIDVVFLREMARETKRLFEGVPVTKVLTVEASGIAFATAVALELNVPMVFAKKHPSANVSGEQYFAPVYSFTHKTTYNIAVSREYLKKEDKVLVADDFLANGNALKGLIDIVGQAGAEVAGCCAEIEKGFQGGGDSLRAQGYKVESLAIVERMENGSITFRT